MAASFDLVYNSSRITSAEPSTIDTRNWEQLLSEASREVFDMMVGLPFWPSSSASASSGEFTAIVGLAGPINGLFSIRCDQRTAFAIASAMLGVDENTARGEVCDALGELCNIIIGNFKAKTGKLGQSAVLAVPTVIRGHDYKIRPLISGHKVECVMQTADGALHLRLDYRLA